jgi:alkylated DNA repair dioxygenase AlkB
MGQGKRGAAESTVVATKQPAAGRQRPLFPADSQTRITMPDGEMVLFPRFFEDSEARALFDQLSRDVLWQQQDIRVAGRLIAQPRLTAWYGDAEARYAYSGLAMQPRPWSEDLLRIKTRIESVSAHRFNSVLLNLYRHGRDSVGWHSDSEPELGRNPVIASLSLGAARRFVLKHKQRKDVSPLEFVLANGNLLVMRGTTQHHWLHCVPKTAEGVLPRINLTFRFVCATARV